MDGVPGSVAQEHSLLSSVIPHVHRVFLSITVECASCFCHWFRLALVFGYAAPIYIVFFCLSPSNVANAFVVGFQVDDSEFLRAVQFTGSDGNVSFGTVFPGWYQDRALHIHVRVHFNITVEDDDSGYTNGTVSHVGQLYVLDEILDQLSQVDPYTENEVCTCVSCFA